jgi:branched-chain amino acid transport system ATP-binding protein
MLEVRKLEVVYHHVSTAVQGVSFKVSQGTIFALIGANGAGKTTTLRAISGFLGSDNAEISDGEVIYLEKNLNGLAPHRITDLGIVLVPERKKIFETLTTVENLRVSVSHRSERLADEEIVWDYFPSLRAHKNHLAGFLSGGEAQMLAIGQALLCSPELLLIDELSMGLAPIVISSLLHTLVKMKNDLDLTMMVVEQNAVAALDIADYSAVMENGRIVFDGTPEKLMAHEDVREFYLGIRETGQKNYVDVKQYKRRRRWWG